MKLVLFIIFNYLFFQYPTLPQQDPRQLQNKDFIFAKLFQVKTTTTSRPTFKSNHHVLLPYNNKDMCVSAKFNWFFLILFNMMFLILSPCTLTNLETECNFVSMFGIFNIIHSQLAPKCGGGALSQVFPSYIVTRHIQ